MSTIRIHENPARLYLDTLAQGSRWSMRQALESAARFLSDGEQGADTFPWPEARTVTPLPCGRTGRRSTSPRQ